jgi:glutathione S-transferase
MRLYHNPLSSNARRAVVTAFALGRKDVELMFVDLAKGQQRTPEYLRMNPMGKVPTLDDDGFFLTESHAIMAYLADQTPGQTLYPTDPRARADVNRWMFWNAHHFAPAVGILGFENMVKRFVGGGDPDPKEVARGEGLVKQLAGVLDAHLATHPFLHGDALTLADIAVATPLIATVPAKLPVSGFANLQAWYGRLQALDAWRQAEPPRQG